MVDDTHQQAIAYAKTMVQAANDAYDHVRRIRDDAKKAVQDTEAELAQVEGLRRKARQTYTGLLLHQNAALQERSSETLRNAMRVHTEVMRQRLERGDAGTTFDEEPADETAKRR